MKFRVCNLTTLKVIQLAKNKKKWNPPPVLIRLKPFLSSEIEYSYGRFHAMDLQSDDLFLNSDQIGLLN